MAGTSRPEGGRLRWSFDVLRFAACYWRRQPGKLALILALFIVGAFLETNLPNALSGFLESVRRGEAYTAVAFHLGAFLVNYFAFTILFNIGYLLYNAFETRVFNDLLDEAFAHVQRLSEHFFINTFTGSIITRIKRGRDRIETFEDQILLRLLPTTVILISSTVLLSFRFPGLSALLAGYLALVIIVSVAMVLRFAGPAQSAYASAEDAFGGHLADSVTGIVTTKAYAQEEGEISRFSRITAELRAKNLRAYHRSNATSFVQQILLGGMLALLLGGGTWYFFRGQASVEDMAYLALAYTIMQLYIREVGENIKNLLTASYDLHGVMALLHEVPQVADLAGARDLQVSRGAVEFDKVTFSYPGKTEPTFKALSVSIRAGERIALVGRSGSGKTTFTRLLQRLYDVQSGAIRIDGQDIAHVTQSSLRQAIALVPQDPILFHRTLRENISYGRPEASFAEVREAARKAHIDEFIMGLPRQYETLVGERGIKLSGGERQRVAIARAILADRPILILDEATSSLDSASERAIQDALRILTHGRTSIMIAHRLSTIQDADRILVFESGGVVEEGTHDELVGRKGGVYAGFFKLQSGAYIGE